MKIDSNLMGPRMSTNMTVQQQTQDTGFAARVQASAGTVANAVAGGLGVAANFVPGGSILSAAVSSVATFANSSGSGSSTQGVALSASASGAVGVPSVDTTVGGGVPGTPDVGGGGGGIGTPNYTAGNSGAVGSEYNGALSGMFEEQKKLLGVQMAMQRENQVFSTISNVLKTRHDTSKNAIGNIR